MTFLVDEDDGRAGSPASPIEPWRVEGVSRSLDDTWSIASKLASILQGGDLVLLTGELGAGKTAFAQGVARALGVREAVTSPTFTLVHEYECSSANVETLLHADLYRLETLGEVEELGLAELLDYGALGLVEWGERAGAALGDTYLEVHLRAVRLEYIDDERVEKSEEVRLITYTGFGTSWTRRRDLASVTLEAHRPDRDIEGAGC